MEITEVAVTRYNEERLVERQNAALTAWSILSTGMGLKTTWEKFLANYGLDGKVREPVTDEQRKEQAAIAAAKAKKIVELDPHRKERMRQRREGK